MKVRLLQRGKSLTPYVAKVPDTAVRKSFGKVVGQDI